MHITHIFAIPFSSPLALTAAIWGTCLLMWTGPCTWVISQFCLMLILYLNFEVCLSNSRFFKNYENDHQHYNSDFFFFFYIYLTPWGSFYTPIIKNRRFSRLHLCHLFIMPDLIFYFLFPSIGCMYRTRLYQSLVKCWTWNGPITKNAGWHQKGGRNKETALEKCASRKMAQSCQGRWLKMIPMIPVK